MREVALGEALDLLIDHRGKTPKKLGGDFTDSGVKVVSAIHIKNGRINWDERERYVSESMFRRWMPCRTRCGDVLLTSEAPLGEVAQVEDDEPLVLSQRVFALRGKSRVLHSTYLRYFLQSEFGRRRLLSMATGSTVSGIRQELLRKVQVPLPPFEEQERIAGVLGAFDDLIETDRRLMTNLAATQQGALARADRVSTIVGECTEFLNRKRVPLSKAQRTANPGKYPYYGATGVVDFVGGFLFDGVHVLVGEDGTVVDDDGRPIVQVPHGKYWVNNHAHVLRGRTASTDVIAVALRAAQVRHVITGAVQAKLSMGNLKSVVVELPVDPEIGLALESLGKGIRALEDEIADLSRQRDELLPLLMSGKVRVRDVRAAVS